MATDTKKPRPMHFATDFSGQTSCHKDAGRVRVTMRLAIWDDPKLAGGRRCSDCTPAAEKARAEAQAKVTP
jgi:hypothetical protein